MLERDFVWCYDSAMKIYISNDHRGVGLKIYLQQMLVADGYSVADLGVDAGTETADFPDVAQRVADKLLSEPDARGIVICGFGGGVVIAANRFRHIRATRCDRPEQAAADRTHNDINVLAFAADDIDIEQAFLCTKAFLETKFDATERRIRRLEKIS